MHEVCYMENRTMSDSVQRKSAAEQEVFLHSAPFLRYDVAS